MVKAYWERITDEALLNVNCLGDNFLNPLLFQGLLQQAAKRLMGQESQRWKHQHQHSKQRST